MSSTTGSPKINNKKKTVKAKEQIKAVYIMLSVINFVPVFLFFFFCYDTVLMAHTERKLRTFGYGHKRK